MSLAGRISIVVVLLTAVCGVAFGDVRVEYDDASGAAGATGAPVSLKLDLPDALKDAASNGQLLLTESGAATPVPAQYEGGRLWWMMPEGKPGKRVFALTAGSSREDAMTFRERDGAFTCMDGAAPVLCYNFKTVPVPPGVAGKYAVARSNYVHPIYGPDGEVLTKDFSKDHPHHRGLYWAWPEVMWKGEKRDLHALQGVIARPAKIVRNESGPVLACIEAENVWKWGDEAPIVRERVEIRAFRKADGNRVLDFTVRFNAIEPGVTLARRGTEHYGGISLRMSPRRNQSIQTSPDPHQAWAELAGIPHDGESPVGVTILQHADNERFPGDWQAYPNLNWLQPTFPSKGERYELQVGKPLVLRCRIVVHPESYDPVHSAALWTAYQLER